MTEVHVPTAGTDNLSARVPRVLVTADDGSVVDPQTPEEWDGWVSAGRTRHYLTGDPLLDWLDRYGEAAGFERDDEQETFDPRTDFLGLIFEQGRRFEEGVLRLIGERLPVLTISTGVEDARSIDAAAATFAAMRAGTPVIAQAVLRNPADRTYGVADLLVRSDVLEELVPGTIDDGSVHVSAPGLGGEPWHYRVVDVKFHTFALDVGRAANASDALPYMAQVLVYSRALGRLQGYLPPAAYLLGRSWKEGCSRGSGCFERLARVDLDAIGDRRTGASLAERTDGALAWVRRLRADGAGWGVLPEPSVPELYPHMRNQRDAPWHGAKRAIGRELRDLTLLPAMNPERRQSAHEGGLRRWSDEGVTAIALDVPDKYLAQCDGVLAANRSAHPVVLPERIPGNAGGWRHPAPLELFVDFETVSNLADDFTRLPSIGGQPLIFQIGAGRWEDGQWRFEQWTAARITEDEEASVIGGFVDHLDALRRARGMHWSDVRLVHWATHERSTFETAYDSAKVRHQGNDWPVLPWFDFLTCVVREAPVTVTGAFDFSLKSLAKAMHAAGLIETTWGEGPTDGMGAMVGAWWCDGEAARLGCSMRDFDLMAEIERYNEVDCRVMAEIVGWLRANR